MRSGLIVNPVAGGGRMRRVLPDVLAVLQAGLGEIVVQQTERAGDVMRCVRALVADEVDLIVAVGGDGTVGDVVDALLVLKAEGQAIPDLAIVAVGTGTDLARGLRLPRRPVEAARHLLNAPTRTLDAGRVEFVADGRAEQRYFLNIASLGLSARVADAVNHGKRQGRASGKLVFLFHTVMTLLAYRPEAMTVMADGETVADGKLFLVAVANGRYFGGGMMIAPDALPDDGLFDLVVLKCPTRLSLLLALPQVYTGAHRNHPEILIRRAREVVVTPGAEPAMLEADGEAPGTAPARFTMIPGALRIRG